VISQIIRVRGRPVDVPFPVMQHAVWRVYMGKPPVRLLWFAQPHAGGALRGGCIRPDVLPTDGSPIGARTDSCGRPLAWEAVRQTIPHFLVDRSGLVHQFLDPAIHVLHAPAHWSEGRFPNETTVLIAPERMFRKTLTVAQVERGHEMEVALLAALGPPSPAVLWEWGLAVSVGRRNERPCWRQPLTTTDDG